MLAIAPKSKAHAAPMNAAAVSPEGNPASVYEIDLAVIDAAEGRTGSDLTDSGNSSHLLDFWLFGVGGESQ